MDIVSIGAAYEGLKNSKQILGAIFEAKVDAEAKPRVLAALEQLGDAQDALFSLREELFRLQTENDLLRRQLADANSWDTRAGQYQLTHTDGGAVVFKFNGQPEHFACPSCFNKHEIHILQDNRTMSGKFRCTGCTAEFPIKPHESAPAPVVHTRRPFI
ncbi:MAG: hypothetical protein KJ795_01775 [Gammaproteobacteria bacterium]|nr:hypothetical protein [Gammaproteobacteria bacterium]MBU1775043.1 hypothetical protein [Gammaproteobacteria bacterium]